MKISSFCLTTNSIQNGFPFLESIKSLKKVVDRINPDEIQINSLDRPGSENWVQKPSALKLKKIATHFGKKARVISKFKTAKKCKQLDTNLKDRILEIIKRRPCEILDLSKILGAKLDEVQREVGILTKNRLFVLEKLKGRVFLKKER